MSANEDDGDNVFHLAPPRTDIEMEVDRLNETYAVVFTGGTTRILRESDIPGQEEFKLGPEGAFHSFLKNQHILIGGEKKKLSHVWMAHERRRTYEGIVFDPSGGSSKRLYNLWEGFAVKPAAGSCERFLDHVRTNVCGGDPALCDWVVGWFADIIQNPGRKVGTSLVLRGEQGTGKTIVGKVIGSLLGNHYRLVSDPRYITGRFNSHLISCLLLHADEGFWAGDKAAEGRLKDLVTGDRHPVELKGHEPIWVANHVRLLVTGNARWQVPAGSGERRFAVLDMGERNRRDNAYFAAIEHEMAHGGREALMRHLLDFDLSKVDLRTIPETTALLDQKFYTLSPDEGWWLDVLKRGKLPARRDDGAHSKSDLYDDYIRHASKVGVQRRSIETAVGMFLRRVVPKLRTVGHRNFGDGGGTQGFCFPTLKTCRRSFADYLKQEIEWGDDDDRRYWD